MGKSRRFNSYREIKSQWQNLIPIFQAIGISVVVALLFYRSLWGIMSATVIIPFWLRIDKENRENRIKFRTATEFKEYMMLIVAGLQTGYSLERAVKQSEDELIKLYPKESVLLEYVHVMNQKISMNMQIEKAFGEFSRAIDLEEAVSLSEIISFAKRCGGDYGRHIRETAIKIEDNISVKQEIETITTEKRLELKVMCVMPIMILAYISLTSPDFISPLYGNAIGICLMTVCLVVYGLLIMLGRKIIDIKV